jgi:hypothetical protein
VSRKVVGLLAAVGAAMSALVGLAHGTAQMVLLIAGAIVAGLAARQALPAQKSPRFLHYAEMISTVRGR